VEGGAAAGGMGGDASIGVSGTNARAGGDLADDDPPCPGEPVDVE
jgi:hypothetical protein